MSLLSHQASERRRERTNFQQKNISLCEILVVTTPIVPYLLRWSGNEEVPGLIPTKRKRMEKKPIKENSVFKLPTIGGLNLGIKALGQKWYIQN